MMIRRSGATIAAIALMLTACGGDDAATTTTVSVGGGAEATASTTPAETTTTTAAPTTTTEAPTTTQAQVASADCLVGTWELDSAAFIEQIFSAASEEETGFEELGEVEISHGGGAFLVTMNEDGTYLGDRDNWQIRLSTDEGTFVNTLDGEESGTWSVDGDQLTVTSNSSTMSVSFAAEVDGELMELPFSGTQTVATRELGGTGPFTCTDDTLEATFEGSTSTFARR